MCKRVVSGGRGDGRPVMRAWWRRVMGAHDKGRMWKRVAVGDAYSEKGQRSEAV